MSLSFAGRSHPWKDSKPFLLKTKEIVVSTIELNYQKEAKQRKSKSSLSSEHKKALVYFLTIIASEKSSLGTQSLAFKVDSFSTTTTWTITLAMVVAQQLSWQLIIKRWWVQFHLCAWIFLYQLCDRMWRTSCTFFPVH